jgi:hypothetical protein
MLSLASEKLFGSSDIVRRELEGNVTVGRAEELRKPLSVRLLSLLPQKLIMLSLASEKCFGSSDIVHRELECNVTVGRGEELRKPLSAPSTEFSHGLDMWPV